MIIMKKIMLLILVIIATLASQAQGKYQISGKVSGMTTGTLLLVRNDGMKPDTIATTVLNNGVFIFSGQVDSPFGGYIAAGDGSLFIPLIVEPVNIMVNVTANGALVQGGKQQELFATYNRIGQAFAAEQAKVQAEAQQPEANMQVLQTRIDRAYQESQTRTNEMIRANANEYATAYVVSLGILNETEESLQQKYNLLGDAAKNSIPGKHVAAALDQFSKLAVGKEAPDFTAGMPNGDTFSMYAVPAKFKLLVFWTSTDAASRQLNPELIQLYQHYRPKGLEIISISLDDDLMAWRKAIEMDGLVWRNGSDLKGRNSDIAKLYMVNTVPYAVLIGEENKIIAKGLLGKELRETIADLTKKKKK